MNYWKIMYRTGGEDYETSELLITNDEYKMVQQLISDGKQFIILNDRPTIKVSSIASIGRADDIIAEYHRTGVSLPKHLNAPVDERFLIENKKPGLTAVYKPHGKD